MSIDWTNVRRKTQQFTVLELNQIVWSIVQRGAKSDCLDSTRILAAIMKYTL